MSFSSKRLGAPFLALCLVAGAMAPMHASAASPVTCEQAIQRKNPFALLWPADFVRGLYERLSNRFAPRPKPQIAEPEFDFLSDQELLQERRQRDKMGLVRSIFSEKFDTRIYFTATGVPDAQGNPPVTDPRAKAVFIYFHGSGTQKASGANFAYKMNKMAMLGYSVIAMDMPFHSDGSRSKNSMKAKKYYKQLNELVETYRIPGKPVYMVGHSFGPEIAAEYIQRFPRGVDGIAMISPAGFTHVLKEWFDKYTSKMQQFWKNSPMNDDGAAWAGVIADQSTWSEERTSVNPDPTLVNPLLKVRVLTGDREEYVPGELDGLGLPTTKKRDYDLCLAIAKIFARVTCRIEAGVGHYIFEHRDESGHDVILREMLALDNQSMANEKQLKIEAKAQVTSELEEVLIRYSRESGFRNYVNRTHGGLKGLHQLTETEDLKQARKIILDYSRYILPQRERAIVENMINTKTWNPAFYAENQAEIEAIDLKKPQVPDKLIAKYTALLESMTPEQRKAFAIAPESVFVVPERLVPEGMQQEKKKKEKPEVSRAA